VDYLDFELRIGREGEDSVRVEVVRSPVGGTPEPLTFRIDTTRFLDDLSLIENSRQGSMTRSRRDVRPMHGDRAVDQARLQAAARVLGAAFFDAVMTGDVLVRYRSSLEMARREKKGLRFRLRIDEPRVSRLPWEFLYDGDLREHVCLMSTTPLIRHMETGRAHEALAVEPPLRILGMVASPPDLPALDVEQEKKDVALAVEHLVENRAVTLTWLEGQTWRSLQKELRQNPYHVFHFVGHGGFDTKAVEGVIHLVSDDGEGSQPLSATILARLLTDHPTLRLAVMNCCEGARASEHSVYSSIGAVLLARGIPAVISMQYVISDVAALEFSRTFYDVLADGQPVDLAMTEARKAISFALQDNVEWGTPVLHMHAPEGRLFSFDVAAKIFRAGARDAAGGAVGSTRQPEPPARPAVPESATDAQGLRILLNKVQSHWVEGVLEHSIHHSALLDLGLNSVPTMVDSRWGSLPLGEGQTITSVFDEFGGSVLILGEPGAGKTTALLRLAKDLIERAEHDEHAPVPVVFSLSSWRASGDLVGWLVAELSAKYQIPKAIGQRWLHERRLTLLLDGLDEVGAEHRASCVEAINALARTAGLANVVCCRLNEYVELPVRLGLNGALRLRGLSREQIFGYVASSGTRLTGLDSLLRRDSSLLVLAQTPFMLNLMVRTFEDLPEGHLTTDAFAGLEAHKRALMDAYVARQFRRVAEA